MPHIQFVIKVLFMTPNYMYVTITITKFHTIVCPWLIQKIKKTKVILILKNYNYFVNVIDYITYIYNQYISALCYFVSCASVQYLLFNVFLTQNYELQFSLMWSLAWCNSIQYIVNYKQQFSFSFFHKIKYVVSFTMTNIHSILYYYY